MFECRANKLYLNFGIGEECPGDLIVCPDHAHIPDLLTVKGLVPQ